MLVEPWTPPLSYKLPNVVQSGGIRHFQRSWLDKFVWLTYSGKDQVAYCNACVILDQRKEITAVREALVCITVTLMPPHRPLDQVLEGTEIIIAT
uniref:(California timema) hypothetical protein n=1 Tax=Timema californicum TaxID=61474 RepID=A0A7R9PDK4_TIMCA|nr:unnamed protein product [Timema californicum]